MVSFFRSALVASLAISNVFAQTMTDCQPLNQTCPPDIALGQAFTFDFTSNDANPAIWNSTATPISFHSDVGAQFEIQQSGDAPNMKTNFNIMFGTVSVIMKAASGTGIVSSITLLSDDLDEIDWEILGGNKTMVESNYFGKGNTTTYDRAIYHEVDFAPQDDYHNYTVTMAADQINWIVDGKVLRTLMYNDAVDGKNFPQTPMKVYLGSWAAGDAKANPPGVVQWAQGATNFGKGPFKMYVKDVHIRDGMNASSYTYSDRSGSWQSIKAASGQSPIVPQLTAAVGPSAKWKRIPVGVRIAIIVCSIGGFFLLCAAVAWFCIKSTRKGLREHAKAEQEWEAQRREAEEWRVKYREDRLSSMNSTTKSMQVTYS